MIFATNLKKAGKGFTLIELLVVIAIIGILSAVIITNLSNAPARGRDATRKADLMRMKLAVDEYYGNKNAYPSTGGSWFGINVNGGSKSITGAGGYIPDLAPTYIAYLPKDPSNRTDGWAGYLYKSDGLAYKIIAAITPESYPASGQQFYDPVRPGSAYMVCSGPPACTTW